MAHMVIMSLLLLSAIAEVATAAFSFLQWKKHR